MVTASSLIPVEPAVYGRKARQIRARFAGRPGAMHAALRGLADRTDRRPWGARVERTGVKPALRPTTDAVESDIAVTSALERGFAQHISDRLASGPFTFSGRMEAMRSAERIGIPRFQANLIVALAQNSRPDAAAAPSQHATVEERSVSPWTYLLVALATEAILATSIYIGMR